MKSNYLFLIVLAAVFLNGCNAGKDKTNVELIQNMMDDKALKSQDFDEIRNKPSFLVPPEGTVPQGVAPYKYAGQVMEAEAKLVNPIGMGEAFDASLKIGGEKYRIYCSVCHGATGKGDGTVAPYFALKPPPLVSDKVKAFRDGRIFHIITDGQGVMKNYATQITNSDDRWAIVNYIRTLQKQ